MSAKVSGELEKRLELGARERPGTKVRAVGSGLMHAPPGMATCTDMMVDLAEGFPTYESTPTRTRQQDWRATLDGWRATLRAGHESCS